MKEGVDQIRMLTSKLPLKRSLVDDELSNAASTAAAAIAATYALESPSATATTTSPAEYMRSCLLLSHSRKRRRHEPPQLPSSSSQLHQLPNTNTNTTTATTVTTVTFPYKLTVTDEQLAGYTMETVTAVRTNDVERLRSLLVSSSNTTTSTTSSTNHHHHHHHSQQQQEQRKKKNVLARACNRNGESLLHLACRRSHLNTIRFLVLEAHVDVSMVDDLGRTCLFDVCWRPNVTEAIEIATFFVQQQHVPLVTTTTNDSSSSSSSNLWHGTDLRGHSCWDYVRREHWTFWHSFLCTNLVPQKHTHDWSDPDDDDNDASEPPTCL
jgi:hypothetical protein